MQRLLKSCLRRLTRHIRVPIRAGPCQGFLWSVPTRIRFLRGDYELRFAEFVAATLNPEDIFWDVGAHFGYYSLLASRIVTRGECFSFEPDVGNRWYLEHHVRWNRIKNITIVPCAIASVSGPRSFGGNGTGSGHLDGVGQTVQVRTVDELIDSRTCRPPTFMKIDVEGAETEVLKSRFVNHAGVICVATHGTQLHSECGELLASYGFEIFDSRASSLLVAVDRKRKDCASVMKRAACLEAH